MIDRVVVEQQGSTLPIDNQKPSTCSEDSIHDRLYMKGRYFTDSQGRVRMLRGINVSGGTKIPSQPNIPTHKKDGLFDTASLSFKDRPFPLSEADSHLTNLRNWGFNLIRFCIPWEAIEPRAPGQIDHDYIDYAVNLIRKMGEYGFKVFIDPHQDTWSRFTGGSGAPLWTLEMVGFDAKSLLDAGCAVYHADCIEKNQKSMVWAVNNYHFGPTTMYTLFFGGRRFAPNFLVNGKNIQDVLQGHFIAAFKALAVALEQANLHDEVVMGYETINEPVSGLIGISDLSKLPDFQTLRWGLTPTPFEGMKIASGIPTKVENWGMGTLGPYRWGSGIANPDGISAWKVSETKEVNCVWARHGVWDEETQTLLDPSYFQISTKEHFMDDFLEQFWKPFVTRYTDEIKLVNSSVMIFLQPPVNEVPPTWDTKTSIKNAVYAPHWYDGYTLALKKFHRWNFDYFGLQRNFYKFRMFGLSVGYKQILNQFISQLRVIKSEGLKHLDEIPIVIGEFGIPFDMDNKKSYSNGDYSKQILALDMNYRAMEKNLLNCVMWNYVPDNQHEFGDQWNDEDLSLVSLGAMESGNVFPKARALIAAARPYATHINGSPLKSEFDICTTTYTLSFRTSSSSLYPREASIIFFPKVHYPTQESIQITVSDGHYKIEFEKGLVYFYSNPQYFEHEFIMKSTLKHNIKNKIGGVIAPIGFLSSCKLM